MKNFIISLLSCFYLVLCLESQPSMDYAICYTIDKCVEKQNSYNNSYCVIKKQRHYSTQNIIYCVNVQNIDSINFSWDIFIMETEYNYSFEMINFNIGKFIYVNNYYIAIDSSLKINLDYFNTYQNVNNTTKKSINADLTPYFQEEYVITKKYYPFTWCSVSIDFMDNSMISNNLFKHLNRTFIKVSFNKYFIYHNLPDSLLKIFNSNEYPLSSRGLLYEKDIDSIRKQKLDCFISKLRYNIDDCMKEEYSKNGCFYVDSCQHQYIFQEEFIIDLSAFSKKINK